MSKVKVKLIKNRAIVRNRNQLWLDENGDVIECKHNIEFLVCKLLNYEKFFEDNKDKIFIYKNLSNGFLSIYADISLKKEFDEYIECCSFLEIDSYPSDIYVFYFMRGDYIDDKIEEIKNNTEEKIEEAIEDFQDSKEFDDIIKSRMYSSNNNYY